MLVNQWSQAFTHASDQVWTNLLSYVPKILFAVLLFALGWLIAVLVARVVEQIIKAIKIDKALKAAGLDELLEKAGMQLRADMFLGALAKWFIILVFFTISLEVVGLNQVSAFMWGVVVPYIPKVAIASLVLIITALVADKVKDAVLASSKAAGVASAKFIANVAKWALWLLGISVALLQLGIGQNIINMFIGGLVFAFSLAFGLAFGLGGKEEAARYLAKMRKDLSDDNDE